MTVSSPGFFVGLALTGLALVSSCQKKRVEPAAPTPLSKSGNQDRDRKDDGAKWRSCAAHSQCHSVAFRDRKNQEAKEGRRPRGDKTDSSPGRTTALIDGQAMVARVQVAPDLSLPDPSKSHLVWLQVDYAEIRKRLGGECPLFRNVRARLNDVELTARMLGGGAQCSKQVVEEREQCGKCIGITFEGKLPSIESTAPSATLVVWDESDIKKIIVPYPWAGGKVAGKGLVQGTTVAPGERFDLDIVPSLSDHPVLADPSAGGGVPRLTAFLKQEGWTGHAELAVWSPGGRPTLSFTNVANPLRMPAPIHPGKATVIFQVSTTIGRVPQCIGFTACAWQSHVHMGSVDVVLSDRFASE